MFKTILVFAVLTISTMASANESIELYQTCKERVTNMSYGSQQWEINCGEDFDMPKPYLIKCANFVKNGFPDKIERASCQSFCEQNEKWGPWYDFELAYDIKEIVFEMKRRHSNRTCRAD